ncbi:uncharacterized protein TNCV_3619881 [Trichonephila clavipes]|nr:uncharacterized protein TNCV_3619881 [Trichonephila clavipes]
MDVGASEWHADLWYIYCKRRQPFSSDAPNQSTKMIQRGTRRPRSCHTLPKLIWRGSWGYNLGQSLSNHGPHVFYRRKFRRASLPGKQSNLVIEEEPLDNACHVWSRIILLKYSCGQALKVRKDNLLQHLGDVALAVYSASNAY